MNSLYKKESRGKPGSFLSLLRKHEPLMMESVKREELFDFLAEIRKLEEAQREHRVWKEVLAEAPGFLLRDWKWVDFVEMRVEAAREKAADLKIALYERWLP